MDPGVPGCDQVLRAPANSSPSWGLSASEQGHLCYSAAVTLDQAAVKTATRSEKDVRSSSGASPHVLGASQVLVFAPCLTSPC